MLKNRFLIILFSSFLLSSQLAKAQSTIHGIILDEKGKSLQSANVLLLKYTDSSLVKGTLSDVNGKYIFENIQQGQYLVSATFSGMDQAFSNLLNIIGEKNNIEIAELHLKPTVAQLKTVTVTGKKQMFEQKIDRMVINVKNSITNAGGTALDVIEKSPGVAVNRQNNTISISGKSNVVVMINGKISYMPADALVETLSGISAGNIEKIELITTPPSKYDAGGNAGYINIVLINNPNAGFNGSYFLTAGYGKRPLAAAGTNFNYRNGKINLYGNYSFTYRHPIEYGTGFTQITKGAEILTNISYTDRDAKRLVHNARLGLDYQLDTATVLGLLLSGYDNRWEMHADNGATVAINNVLDTTIKTINKEINHWQNLMTNINFQHTFNPRKILYIDANYIYYKDNNPNTYTNNYYDKTNSFLYRDDVRSMKLTPINVWVFSSDYTTTIGKKINMESGAKVSFSNFTNDVSVDNLKNNMWVSDPTISANYLLKENIGAAYASFLVDINPKTSMKAGLRYEYTFSNLGTTQTANIIDRKYGEFFPTFYISHKINANNSLNFSYSRRINRPSFNDLAPFTIFFDPKTFFTGNPALQPAISNNLQASYLYKNFIFSLSYTHESNSIEGFQTNKVDTISNMLYLTPKNFNYEQYLTGSFSLPFTIKKWWSMQNNINIDWRQISTSYNNAGVKLSIVDYNFNSTQTFTLPKDFSLELTGYYYSSGYYGTGKFKPVWQIDAGIQKKFSDKKNILRFSASDIFNTGNNYKFVENLPIKGTTIRGSLNFASIAFKLTFTHNFGNKALKEKRERATGAETELNRVHN